MYIYIKCMDTPVRPCHLLTAKRRFAVTVMIAGDVRPGWVLAATWVTGELDGNFSTMITSCCICSVNISGVCRRRYCSGPPPRWTTQRSVRNGLGKEPRSSGEEMSGEAAAGVSEDKAEGQGGKRTERKFMGFERGRSNRAAQDKEFSTRLKKKRQKLLETVKWEKHKWKESRRGRAASIFVTARRCDFTSIRWCFFFLFLFKVCAGRIDSVTSQPF